ncbi:hypothetical protein TNCV_102341 [Trichonephila clavipes]|nr:hypothetical protein TNCV_102341 [Trichonephila clavipes]
MLSFLVLSEGDTLETGGVMDKCVQMLDKELGRLGPDGPGEKGGDRKREKRDERERGARPWLEEREKPCPGWRKHEMRALVGTDGKRAREKRA